MQREAPAPDYRPPGSKAPGEGSGLTSQTGRGETAQPLTSLTAVQDQVFNAGPLVGEANPDSDQPREGAEAVYNQESRRHPAGVAIEVRMPSAESKSCYSSPAPSDHSSAMATNTSSRKRRGGSTEATQESERRKRIKSDTETQETPRAKLVSGFIQNGAFPKMNLKRGWAKLVCDSFYVRASYSNFAPSHRSAIHARPRALTATSSFSAQVALVRSARFRHASAHMHQGSPVATTHSSHCSLSSLYILTPTTQ